MRRDSSSRPGRWVDYVEEETKVRKNLSRLIHTVQHMPSTRYRRDASTLWNLVDELESFQPPDPSTFDYSKKTTRKSFSRKYLDLRLYPSRDRSISPKCSFKNQKQENKLHTFNSNSFRNNKKSDLKKKDTDRNVEPNASISQDKRYFNKSKPDRSKNCKENLIPDIDKNKVSSINGQVSSELKVSQSKPRSKLHNFQPRRKTVGTTTYKQNVVSERSKNKQVDKIKELKQVDFIKEKPNSSNQLKQTINKVFPRKTPLENDQASMVKKLTSYWNNLLSKEVDDNEFSSSHESSDDPMINKSVHDLARRIYRKGRDLQRRVSLSRHISESSIDILRNIEGFTASSDSFNNHKENKDKFIECLSEILSKSDVSSNTKYKKGLRSKKEPLSYKKAVPTEPRSLEMYFDKSCGDNIKLSVDKNGKFQENFKPNFDLKAHHAIDVMDKLVCKLKRFSELPLTCDQIPLPHSLRTMLCLMTATVVSSEENWFDEYLEHDVDVETAGDEEIDCKVDLRLSSGCSELSDAPVTGQRNTNARNDNLQLVAVQGITMREVEDALRYLALCKDYLWTEFLLSSRYYGEDLYNRGSNIHSPRSFTFLIEEEILFGEDSDEDQCYFENESEDDEQENTTDEAYKSLLDFVFISLERLTDLTADLIINYWPDSVHDFVRILYQMLVSLLVWWVIMKEIFYK